MGITINQFIINIWSNQESEAPDELDLLDDRDRRKFTKFIKNILERNEELSSVLRCVQEKIPALFPLISGEILGKIENIIRQIFPAILDEKKLKEYQARAQRELIAQVKQGNPIALEEYLLQLAKKHPEKLDLCQRALGGNRDAQFAFAICLEQGELGDKGRSYAQMFFLRAALQNDLRAMVCLCIESSLLCPISGMKLHGKNSEAVFCCSDDDDVAISYHEGAIRWWLARNNTCPIRGTPLTNPRIHPNFKLRDIPGDIDVGDFCDPFLYRFVTENESVAKDNVVWDYFNCIDAPYVLPSGHSFRLDTINRLNYLCPNTNIPFQIPFWNCSLHLFFKVMIFQTRQEKMLNLVVYNQENAKKFAEEINDNASQNRGSICFVEVRMVVTFTYFTGHILDDEEKGIPVENLTVRYDSIRFRSWGGGSLGEKIQEWKIKCWEEIFTKCYPTIQNRLLGVNLEQTVSMFNAEEKPIVKCNCYQEGCFSFNEGKAHCTTTIETFESR